MMTPETPTVVPPALDHPDRHLPLPGTRNLRDVGGYPTAAGRRTRWRTLLRTDSLDLLPGDSQAALLDLGLRQAIDLRWPSELAKAPSVFRDSPRVLYRSIPLLAFEEDDPTPYIGLVGMYRRILDERGAHLVEVVRAVIAPEGTPVAIGCAAGKDRTGVAIAIILAAVGVPRELVVADYALSAGFFSGPVDDPHLVDWRSGPVETESPPEYMEEVLRHLDERHGGALALLRAGGMTDEELDRLVKVLTEA
ncbi:MAG: tyrosine-protein phosphatase [Candidatus Limnocylindrales bacterium]